MESFCLREERGISPRKVNGTSDRPRPIGATPTDQLTRAVAPASASNRRRSEFRGGSIASVACGVLAGARDSGGLDSGSGRGWPRNAAPWGERADRCGVVAGFLGGAL
jgi:hypothetical protein